MSYVFTSWLLSRAVLLIQLYIRLYIQYTLFIHIHTTIILLTGCIVRWGVPTMSPRRYTGGTHSTGELNTRKTPVAAANRRGAARGGAGAAGVCVQTGECGVRGGGPDVSCAGAALRCHPVGTPAEPTPQVSWAVGKRRWPPPIAAVRPLGALARPGCARRRGGGRGRMRCSGGRASQSHTTRPNHPNEQQTPSRGVTVAQHIYHQNYHLTLLVLRIHVDSKTPGT